MSSPPALEADATAPTACSVCHNLDLDNPAYSQLRSHSLDNLRVSAVSCIICSVLQEGIERWKDQLGLQEEIDSQPTTVDLRIEEQHFIVAEIRGADKNVNLMQLEFYNHRGTRGPWTKLRSTIHQPGPKEWKLDDIVEWMSKQITTCETSHPACDRSSTTPPALPTRILDVNRGETNVYLVESAGSSGKYGTLSHCWGSHQVITTTRETLAARQEGIEMDALPKTFRDAVDITRGLGVQYLWIDSLCIIQGDKDDWETESSRMADVYSNGHFNIAATGSKDSRGGCFSQGSPRYLEIERIDDDHGPYIIYVRVGLDTGHRMGLSFFIPTYTNFLLNRAWVHQERILSRRCFQFTSSEILIECASITDCECLNPLYKHATGGSLLRPNLDPDGFPDMGNDPTYLRRWDHILSYYSRMNLTKEEDRLPALSGIAAMFAAKSGQSYVAGLWKEQMPRALLWSYFSHGQPTETYIAPSWSWAKARGAVHGVGFGNSKFAALPGTEVLDVTCDIDGKNPFGRVTKGTLTLAARTLRLAGLENDATIIEKTSRIVWPNTQLNMSLSDFKADYAEDRHDSETLTVGDLRTWVFAFIGFGVRNEKTAAAMLALRPGEKAGSYVRIGCVTTDIVAEVAPLIITLPVERLFIV